MLFPYKDDGCKIMPTDMTLYFNVVKQIQDQINRITYANQLNEQERLNLLSRLEHDISQKFHWARRSVDSVDVAEHSSEFGSQLGSEMDVA